MLPRVPFLSNLLFIVIVVVSLSLPCREGKTLAIIEPDGLYDNCTDRIKNAIFDSGFTIVKEMLIQLDEEAAMSFYAEHSSRSFFSSLVKYMTSGPVLIMVLEKESAVVDWRALIGPTDASKAKITHPNSIRAMCGLDLQKNCVHGSDSPQSAQRDISFFFKEKSSGSAVTEHDELLVKTQGRPTYKSSRSLFTLNYPTPCVEGQGQLLYQSLMTVGQLLSCKNLFILNSLTCYQSCCTFLIFFFVFAFGYPKKTHM